MRPAVPALLAAALLLAGCPGEQEAKFERRTISPGMEAVDTVDFTPEGVATDEEVAPATATVIETDTAAFVRPRPQQEKSRSPEQPAGGEGGH